MSGAQIRFEGDVDELCLRLREMSNINVRGVLNSIGEGIKTSTMERFREERAPDGRKWKSSIRAEETGGKTLTDTTDLRTSIHVESSNQGVAVGTNDVRAATHQFGDERIVRPKRGKALKFMINGEFVVVKQVKLKIPARPYLGINEDDLQEVKDTLENALNLGGL